MRYLKYLSLILIVLLASFTVMAQDEAESCELSYLFNAWARPANEATPNSAIYGQLIHIGDMSDTLISASTNVAKAVELHEMVVGEGDVMQMRPVEGGFMVSLNSFLELAPGGYHIMLIGLNQELIAGEEIELTLNFEQAGEVHLIVPIKDMTAIDKDMDMDMDMSEASEGMPEMGMPMMDWGAGCSGLYFLDAWARPTVPEAPNSAAYGLLVNLSAEERVLVSALTDVAEVVELHEMVMGEGDVMQMRPVEGGIVLPAGSATLLKPGGLHIMLINLNSELPVGEDINLTLTFDDDTEIILPAPIREPKMGAIKGNMDSHSDSNDS